MPSTPPSRRDLLKGALALTAASAATSSVPYRAHAQGGAMQGRSRIDGVLKQATDAKEVPGVVAMAATDKGIVYEGQKDLDRCAPGGEDTRAKLYEIMLGTKPPPK